MSEYVSRTVEGQTGRFVESIWFARGRMAEPRELIAPTGSTVAALDVVEATLVTPEPYDRHAIGRCEVAVRNLIDEPNRPVSDIAAALGLSHGYLDRLFTDQVGLSPRTLARVLRVRRLLEDIDVHAMVGWADKATVLGWFDQAHLIRDFKRHTGVTPSQYVAAQRSAYDRDEAAVSAGFVPEVR
uniref:helix-turn-helix domain-containing protein n=1 Tax=Paractinoplanes polyasparticus TaxID=2856853 RepID=UPI001C85A40F|nr:AraC family transcriptional regulator [Actinoplanes polyasparticus]